MLVKPSHALVLLITIPVLRYSSHAECTDTSETQFFISLKMSHPVDATLPQLCLTLSSAAFGGGGGGQATHAEQASLDRVGKKGKRERGNNTSL